MLKLVSMLFTGLFGLVLLVNKVLLAKNGGVEGRGTGVSEPTPVKPVLNVVHDQKWFHLITFLKIKCRPRFLPGVRVSKLAVEKSANESTAPPPLMALGANGSDVVASKT